jgi:iron complex outermembrane receptor protein
VARQKTFLARKSGFVLMSLLISILNVQLPAQEPYPNKQKDFFEMSIEELMDVEVVSASRQARKIGELSVPVSVITAEDIHYSGLTSIPEILQFAPGMDVLQVDRNRFAVGVRGLHEVYSDRLLGLTDGRAADCINTGGPRFPQLPVLLEDIERIEIVRGPSEPSKSLRLQDH